MDEFDKLRMEINQEQQALEDLEETFYKDKKAIDERYEQVEMHRMGVQLKTEVQQEELVSLSRQADLPVSEAYPHTSSLLEQIVVDNEELARLDRHLLDERLDKLEKTYSNAHRKQEDKLEAALAKLRLLD